MSTSAVSSTNSTNTSAASTSSSSMSALGKDDFLKLMITQLQNQDPLKPMDDTQYIAQLAQFSSLEQMSNISSTMESTYKSQSASSALSMIGKTVEWADAETGTVISGKVDSISFIDSMPKLNVGSNSVEVSNVVRVY